MSYDDQSTHGGANHHWRLLIRYHHMVLRSSRLRMYSHQFPLLRWSETNFLVRLWGISSGVAMGLAIVLITGYAWTRELSLALLIPAIPSTLLVGSIMLTNNIRDIRNDESHGRRTLPIVPWS